MASTSVSKTESMGSSPVTLANLCRSVRALGMWLRTYSKQVADGDSLMSRN